jgi:hypothetical protein
MEDFYFSINFEILFFWVEYPRAEIIFIQCLNALLDFKVSV